MASLMPLAISCPLPAPSARMMMANLRQVEFPFRHQGVFGAAGDGADAGQVARVAAHHLDDEGPGMGAGGVLDAVHCVEDVVECRVDPERHVGEGDIIVNAGGDADDREAEPMEGQGSGKGTVAPEYDQPLDAESCDFLDGIMIRLMCSELV
jgi:hypothetical protein